MNTNWNPPLERDSHDHMGLMQHYAYDLMLWHHAVHLFAEKAKLQRHKLSRLNRLVKKDSFELL